MERITSLTALLESQLGVKTHPEINPLPSAIATSATQILPNNDNRIGIDFVNNGTVPVYIWTDNGVSASKGILLDASGGFLSLNWRDDLSLVANEWWAIAIGGAGVVNTLGVVLL